MSDELDDDETNEFLRTEYDSNISLLTHWDNQIWMKNRFFLLIESAFLGVGLQFTQKSLVDDLTVSLPLLGVIIFVSSFNIYLSYVWFRALRRSREYIEARMERGKELELLVSRENLAEELWQSYNAQDKMLSDKGSSRWEISVPLVFIMIWFGVGVLAVIIVWLNSGFEFPIYGSILWYLVIAGFLCWFEKGSWFRADTGREYDSRLE